MMVESFLIPELWLWLAEVLRADERGFDPRVGE